MIAAISQLTSISINLFNFYIVRNGKTIEYYMFWDVVLYFQTEKNHLRNTLNTQAAHYSETSVNLY